MVDNVSLLTPELLSAVGQLVVESGHKVAKKSLASYCAGGVTHLDGQEPLLDEFMALQLSLVFAFVDRNPSKFSEDDHGPLGVVTTDNAELHVWPIDLEQGRVILNAGGALVEVRIAGYKICDPKMVLRPPLELHIPILAPSADPLVLTGIYETVLGSLRSPGEDSTADRVRVAVEWLAKAWSNARAVQLPERLQMEMGTP